MSCNLTVTTIDENECIGDSLGTINSNFESLDSAVCYLSARVSTTNTNTAGVASLSGYYKLNATPRTGVVTVSQKFCPPWHIGMSGKPLYQETGANRISQQIALSAQYLQHLQYVVSQNSVLSGGEKVRVSTATNFSTHEGSTLMADGRVFSQNYDGSGPAKIFDPNTETIVNVTQNLGKYFSSGSVLLPDGRIFLLRNGLLPSGGASDPIAGFLFNPATNAFTTAGGLAWGQTYPNSPLYYAFYGQTLLPDGKVYLNPSGNNCPAIIYDPASDTTRITASTSIGISTSCVSLADGRVYRIPGGGNLRAQIYNPYNDTFTTALGEYTNTNGSQNGRGGWHSGCLLPDGRLFIAPGQGSTGAKIFDPNATTDGTALIDTPADGYPTSWGGSLVSGSSTLLPDGRVLVAPYDSQTTAVIYNPKTNKNQVIEVGSGKIGYLLKDGRIFLGSYTGAPSFVSLYVKENFSFAAISGPHMNQTY